MIITEKRRYFLVDCGGEDINKIRQLLKENPNTFNIEFNKHGAYRIWDPYRIYLKGHTYTDNDGWTNWSH